MGGFSHEALVAKAHAEAKNFSHHLVRTSWDLGQLFAFAFFICCFLVYLFPLMSVWAVAFDTHVTFWFGNYPFWWTLPIPLMWFAVLLYHMRRHYPKRKVVMISIIVPCVVFFLLGASLKVKSDHLMDTIIYDDCGTRIGEYSKIFGDLDQAANEAERYFEQCNPSGIPIVTLENCPKFSEWRKPRAKEWDYLQYLENHCACTNFCHTGRRSVWTPPAVQAHDSCSNCVLSVMRTKVQHVGYQLMFYAILVLVVALLWIRLMKSTLEELGAEMRWNELHSSRHPDQLTDRFHTHRSLSPNHYVREPVFVPAPVPPALPSVSLAQGTVPAPAPASAPGISSRTAAAPMPMQSPFPAVVSDSMPPSAAAPQTHPILPGSAVVTSHRSEPAPSSQALPAGRPWLSGPPMRSAPPGPERDPVETTTSVSTTLPPLDGRL